MTLIGFIRARLDEDEQATLAAVRATAPHWKDCGDVVIAYDEGDRFASEVADLGYWFSGHIARHDPARVRRQVQALRRIVDVYIELLRTPEPGGPTYFPPQPHTFGPVMHDAVIRPIASIWSDHPDYRREWVL